MELTRIYYPFTASRGLLLDVTVRKGDPVEYGTTALPFTADGELSPGDMRRFDSSFVLNVPGSSDVEVEATSDVPRITLPPDPREGAEPHMPTETEMREGGVTAVERATGVSLEEES